MKTLLRVLLALTALAIPVSADAQNAPPAGQPFLNPLFADNMVLQRGQSDPVWGWTTPGTAITVNVAGKSAKAVAGTDGKWTATLPPLPVGGPYTLTVTGPQTVTLKNVLVGDVWICSGQSNMEFGMGNLTNADQEIAAANYPQIRLCLVHRKAAVSPQTTIDGTWAVCTPKNIRVGGWAGFSAVGYFFGRDLFEDLHVPIGLVESDWGGTPAEAWTSASALVQKLPEFRPAVAQVESERGADPYPQQVSDWFTQNDLGTTKNWQDAALDDTKWPVMPVPGSLPGASAPELAKTRGVKWFRFQFDLPAEDAGKDAVLHFLANDNDTTWVNGTRVGATNGAGQKRAYPVAATLLKPMANVIAIRVLDAGGKGGIYGDPTQTFFEVSGGQNVALAGPWHFQLGADLAKVPPLPVRVNQNFPGVLYNGMINPLIPFGIKGAIWYQGETNEGRAYQYRTLLPTMIGDWRTRWNEGDFPFLIVQLAGFRHPPTQPGDDAWAELREAQWMTARDTPNTGIATAIDIGNQDNIHPKNKQEVGRRLALVARAQVYHEKVEDYGPIYQSMTTDGSAIRLTFTHVDGGLVTQGGGSPTGFAVAGDDHKWAWADAKIDGDTVVVSAAAVPHPVAVRYAWASGPIGNLASQDGLPLFPFRTDDWPGVTANNK